MDSTLLTFHSSRDWLNDVAFWNMRFMDSTLLTFHSSRDWLNDVAPSNILFMDLTLSTFQLFRGWSNDFARWNILFMDLTLSTSHSFKGWLNNFAPRNMPCIFSILLTSQFSNDWSNDLAPRNIYFKLLTFVANGGGVEGSDSRSAHLSNKLAAEVIDANLGQPSMRVRDSPHLRYFFFYLHCILSLWLFCYFPNYLQSHTCLYSLYSSS